MPLNPKEPVASGGYCVINFELINTDPGAIYNSGFIAGDIFGGLASELLSLPANAENYDTIEELMLDWSLTIRSPPTGQVYNGWQNRINPDGSVDLWNIGGRPGDYDLWTSTPGSSMMALTLGIPLFQLDFDGEIGYSPEFDVSIVLSGTVFSGAFVGVAGDGFNFWYAPMYDYILSYPYLSCSYIDISGDGFIDLSDFVYISDNWLTDYGIEDLHLFLAYWLTACEPSEPLM